LQVLAIVNASAAASDDQLSNHVISTTLTAVVSAWVSHGKDLQQLWQVIVQALPRLPAHRRMVLVTTMLSAAQSDLSCLPAGLLELLSSVVQLQESRIAAKKAAKQQAANDGQHAPEQATVPEDDGEWLLELASQLAAQVSTNICKACKYFDSQAYGPCMFHHRFISGTSDPEAKLYESVANDEINFFARQSDINDDQLSLTSEATSSIPSHAAQ
jgi:hypothetical protein